MEPPDFGIKRIQDTINAVNELSISNDFIRMPADGGYDLRRDNSSIFLATSPPLRLGKTGLPPWLQGVISKV